MSTADIAVLNTNFIARFKKKSNWLGAVGVIKSKSPLRQEKHVQKNGSENDLVWTGLVRPSQAVLVLEIFPINVRGEISKYFRLNKGNRRVMVILGSLGIMRVLL